MNTQRSSAIGALAAAIMILAGLPGICAADMLSDPPITVRTGTVASEQLGYAVCTAGDVNGDGYSDLLMSDSSNHGTVWCYNGSASLSFSSPSWTVSGGANNYSLGATMAPAGDVNGDGYADVVLTDYVHNIIYVYLGSANGLQAQPQATITGPASSNFGEGICSAGDVNGDGYDDIIVGAPNLSDGQSFEGGAYLYLGSANGIQSSPAWTFESNLAQSYLGYRVSTAGDVNGDGYADVIVTAPDLSNGQSDEGRVYLFLGGPSGLSANPSWTYEGNQASAEAGKWLACAGDVNGDGYSDIVLNIFNNTSACQVLVFYGGPNGPGNAPDYVWNVHDYGDLFTAGDLNGDGCAEIVAGDFVDNNFRGQITVLGGSQSGGFPVVAHRTGMNPNDNFGVSVRAAGDVNGDGYGDLIVGEPGYDGAQTDEGRVVLYLGGPSLPATTPFGRIGTPNSRLGYSIAQGDWNGDGYTDLAVGNPYDDTGGTDQGRVDVYYGGPTGYAQNPNWSVFGHSPTGHLGWSVGNAGDVDNDGCEDLVIGEPDAGGPSFPGAGAAYLYRGSRSGLSTSPSWTITGGSVISHLGTSVAGAGDVNGDGFADVVIGAPTYSPGGQAYVYLGSANGLGANPAWSASGGNNGDNFGFCVASGGDINGDGYSDVVIGAPLKETGSNLTDEGMAFVFYGSSSGLAMNAGWSGHGGQAGMEFGFAIASGDLNNDGLSEVVIGAPNYNNGGNANAGEIFVFAGQTTGLQTPPVIFIPGHAASDQYGRALAVGDVNNDGFADLAVGAPTSNSAFPTGGLVDLYLGSAGLLNGPVWTIQGPGSGALFGYALGLSGDITGDGVGDILVGIPSYSGTGPQTGAINIFYGGRSGLPQLDNGVAHLPRQFRSDQTTSIALLGGSDQQTSLVMGSYGRSCYGRTHVRAQYQIAPVGVTFSGVPLLGGARDTGAPVSGLGSAVYVEETASGLTQQTAYHWRMRFQSPSPFFPHTPWYSIPGNGGNETDARTASGQSDVASGVTGGSALRFARVGPNPCREGTTLHFVLPVAGEARLTVHDVTGRLVATLVDGAVEAGLQTATWDTRDARGDLVAAGVYFARLEEGAKATVTKVVVRR